MSADIGPGDLVECIDASLPRLGYRDGDELIMGMIYTVERTLVWNGLPGLVLKEAARPPETRTEYNGDCGYLLRRFRPVRRPDPKVILNLLKVPTRDLVPA